MGFPPFKARLEAGETLFAAWAASPSAAVADTLAQAGWDGVVIDTQHGVIGYHPMFDMAQAVARRNVPAIIRVPLHDDGVIGRALDAGASGIICPMVNSADDARWLATAAKYPPLGERSWAPAPAMDVMGLGKEPYLHGANDGTLVWAMIETARAVDALDDILDTPGLDGVFVGPNDLCVSLTGGKKVDPGVNEVLEATAKIAEKAIAHKRFAGIYANTLELAERYIAMGYRFITIGNDRQYLTSGSRQVLDAARAAVKG